VKPHLFQGDGMFLAGPIIRKKDERFSHIAGLENDIFKEIGSISLRVFT
jgi:hypothetical protein